MRYLCSKIRVYMIRFKIFAFVIFLLLSCLQIHAKNAPSASQQAIEAAHKKYAKEDYPAALTLYIRAMELARKEGNDSIYLFCTVSIGNIYDAFGDHKSSLAYYLKGYEAVKKTGMTNFKANFLTNIVTEYARLGNAKEAKKYFALCEKLPQNEFSDYQKYFFIYNRARVFAVEGRYAEAIDEHRRAMRFAQNHNMGPMLQLYQKSEIGNIYTNWGKPKEAIVMGRECVHDAKKTGSGEMLVNAYKMLADAFRLENKPDSVEKYRKLYFLLNDSVYNTKQFYEAQSILNDYEEREQQYQISLLNQRILMQKYVTVSIIAFLLLVLIFSYVLYKKNRNLTKTQRLLIDRNKDMERREQQNRTLLKQYLEQIDKNTHGNEKQNEEKREEKRDEELENNCSSQHSDDIDKHLLSLINDAMNDTSVISNPDFSLQMLAEMVESNMSYVSRIINNSYQKNFKTLLNERRIQEACHKLTDRQHYGSYTMQVIYEEVGYKSASSFIRAFKRIYNMTPSEYQKVAIEKENEETRLL